MDLIIARRIIFVRNGMQMSQLYVSKKFAAALRNHLHACRAVGEIVNVQLKPKTWPNQVILLPGKPYRVSRCPQSPSNPGPYSPSELPY